MTYRADLAVLYEHPEWQKPLFRALERRGINHVAVDLRRAAFCDADEPLAPLYFNQGSALSYLRALQIRGVRVLNGADALALALSKTAQAALLRKLDVPAPRAWTFNALEAIRARAHEIAFPVLLKPEQGGGGARSVLVESFAQLETLLKERPQHWLPDNLLLLQEYFPTDPAKGIVRMEFLGGELLYAMRVINTAEFHPYLEVPSQAVAWGKRIVAAGKLDVAGIEYLETLDGRLMFCDINANSNLRPSVAHAFGFDPFERVVDFLAREVRAYEGFLRFAGLRGRIEV